MYPVPRTPHDVPHPDGACQEGQVLVERNLHHQVVVPGLTAALHALLRQPVAQRTDHAAEEAAAVGEEGSVQQSERQVKSGCALPPALPKPPYPGGNADERQRNHEDRKMPHVRPSQAVHSPRLVGNRPVHQLDWQRGELGQNQGQEQNHQIQAALRSQALQTVPLEQEVQAEQQGNHPHEQRANGQEGRNLHAQADIAGSGSWNRRLRQGVVAHREAGVQAHEAGGDGEEQSRGYQHEQEESALSRTFPFLAEDARQEKQPQEDEQLGGVDEAGLFGCQVQGSDGAQDEQVTFLPVLQVAQGSPQRHQPPEGDESLVAHIAPVVQHVRRNDEQKGRNQRTGLSQVAPVGPQEGHTGDAEQGRRDARRGIAIAKQEVTQRHGVELERPVHHRVVLVAFADCQFPRKVGVQTFIVAHHTRAQVVKTCCDGQQQDESEEKTQPGGGFCSVRCHGPWYVVRGTSTGW